MESLYLVLTPSMVFAVLGIFFVKTEEEQTAVGFKALLVQGVATSIDALSVGFTISDYNWTQALLACLLIGVVTFFICYAGLAIGKKPEPNSQEKPVFWVVPF